MNKAVVLTPDGSRVIGEYDCYGHVGGYNLVDQIGPFAVWHHACWELAGKPEYDREATHARDQGFCHAMHGTPLPKPTSPEWFHVARMWHAIDAVLHRWGSLLCDLDYAREEALWNSLSLERKKVLAEEFTYAQVKLDNEWYETWSAYLRAEDNNPEPKRQDPKTYTFDDVTFDAQWLGFFVRNLKNDIMFGVVKS